MMLMVTDKPSQRNKHVRIEKPTETVTAGKISTAWTEWAMAWVKIEPLAGREYWEAQQQASSITHKITGLFSDFEKVTADFRIVWDSRTFKLLEPPRNIEEASVIYEMNVEEETR